MTDNNYNRFKCPCCNKNEIDPRIAHLVQAFEVELLAPLTVTSGYRCKKHNLEQGGSKTSSHLKGLAVDLACTTSRLRYNLIKMAIRLGITRIGIGKNFLHLDIDRQKDPNVIWLY